MAQIEFSQNGSRNRGVRGTRLLAGIAYVVAAACLLPMVAVVLAAVTGGTDTISHLMETVLPGYIATTLILVVLVAAGTFSIGTGAAWLVTMTRFPGVRFLEIASGSSIGLSRLMFWPMPTRSFWIIPGIVQSTLRDVTGWGPRDYWFPEIRSTEGAAVMLILVLYPYVYLLGAGCVPAAKRNRVSGGAGVGQQSLAGLSARFTADGATCHCRRRSAGRHGDHR